MRPRRAVCPLAQFGHLQFFAVDEDAVAASQVAQKNAPFVRFERRVAGRNKLVIELDVASGGFPDDRRAFRNVDRPRLPVRFRNAERQQAHAQRAAFGLETQFARRIFLGGLSTKARR
ncbi:MAG: hypothetical protein M5R36_18865 [Deltaproteobacteria bacterium]|nr:hypothetical protein [Deltaproteobacteria bacterium]